MSKDNTSAKSIIDNMRNIAKSEFVEKRDAIKRFLQNATLEDWIKMGARIADFVDNVNNGVGIIVCILEFLNYDWCSFLLAILEVMHHRDLIVSICRVLLWLMSEWLRREVHFTDHHITKKPQEKLLRSAQKVSRDDWIRTSDTTPPRRVL